MKEHTIHHLCVVRYKTGIQFSLYYFNCLRKKGETIMLKKFLTLLISALMLICCLLYTSQLRLPFFYCNLFCKQTARLILICLSKILGTPCFSHRRDTKQGYEFLTKLYQAASRYYLSLSFVFYLLALRITNKILWVDP